MKYRSWQVLELIRHPRHMIKLQAMKRSTNVAGYSLAQFKTSRSVYVHIPKASGVSITRTLYGNLGCGHMTMREYERAFGPDFLQKSYVFTFVRNPWDRLFSAYRFLAKGGMNRADAQWLELNKDYMNSFSDFVEKGLSIPNIAGSVHILPQVHFLDTHFNKPDYIDFIGFYENLNDDFAQVSQRVLGHVVPLSHFNKTPGTSADYRRAYTDTMRRIAGDFYRQDIERFGYDFEGASLSAQIDRRNTGVL